MVVDDHTLFRKGFISILKQYDDVEVVGEAENGAEFLAKYGSLNIDVVLIDMDMPVMNGLVAIEKLQERKKHPPCLMISMHNEDKYIIKAIESGANGYLSKDAEPEEILTAIQSIHANGFYFNEKVNLIMLKNLNQKKKIAARFQTDMQELTDRDIALINYISEEMTSVEIAEKLFCSPRTVEGFRAELFKKVGVKNSVGLILFGLKNGILKL